jgi:hypothetical protein
MKRILLARLLFASILLLSVNAGNAGARAESTCSEVTNCQSNDDCFGGVCTRRGVCLCPA